MVGKKAAEKETKIEVVGWKKETVTLVKLAWDGLNYPVTHPNQVLQWDTIIAIDVQPTRINHETLAEWLRGWDSLGDEYRTNFSGENCKKINQVFVYWIILLTKTQRGLQELEYKHKRDVLKLLL